MTPPHESRLLADCPHHRMQWLIARGHRPMPVADSPIAHHRRLPRVNPHETSADDDQLKTHRQSAKSRSTCRVCERVACISRLAVGSSLPSQWCLARVRLPYSCALRVFGQCDYRLSLRPAQDMTVVHDCGWADPRLSVSHALSLDQSMSKRDLKRLVSTPVCDRSQVVLTL